MGTICNNKFSNVVHAGTYSELGHSVYSNNIMEAIAHGPHIESGMIGPQKQMGNRWDIQVLDIEGNGIYYAVDINDFDGYHIKCSGVPSFSRFFVHTDQASQLFDLLHPYHPFVIIPDMENEFFEQQNGNPQGCVLEWLASGISDIDKLIADGNFDAFQGIDSVSVWQNQRNLYRLLLSDLNYVERYEGFVGFLAQHQHSDIGKFHQINTLLKQAAAPSSNIHAEAEVQQQIISDNVEEFIEIDKQLEHETDQAIIAGLLADQATAASQIESAKTILEELQSQYNAPRMAYFLQAQDINNSVNTSSVYGANEKSVNQVMLNALINQLGQFTEQDIEVLKNVADQCPTTGGTAVMKARSLLPDCIEGSQSDYTVDCMGNYSEHSVVSTRPISSQREDIPRHNTTTIVGQQNSAYLDLPFEHGCSYMIVDLAGRLIVSGEFTSSRQVDIPSGLASGLYFCRVEYPSGKATIKKLLITK